MIKLSEAQQIATSKADLHTLCELAGYRMPSKESSIVTVDFLNEVRQGMIAVPKYNGLLLAAAPFAPDKKTCHQELVKMLTDGIPKLTPEAKPGFERLLVHLAKGMGDRQWYLDVICTLSEREHAYFQKSYVPAPKKKEPSAEEI